MQPYIILNIYRGRCSLTRNSQVHPRAGLSHIPHMHAAPLLYLSFTTQDLFTVWFKTMALGGWLLDAGSIFCDVIVISRLVEEGICD